MKNYKELDVVVQYNPLDNQKLRPTVVISGDFGIRGFDINPETGEMFRACVCSAYSKADCICEAYKSEPLV